MFRTLALLLAVLIMDMPQAYEVGTHSRMTHESYSASILSYPSTYQELGVENNADPFGQTYYDMLGSEVRVRSGKGYVEEELRMPRLQGNYYTIRSWLMRGSIREDDIPKSENPQDDPYNENLYRVFHHFYDPIHDQGLFVPGIAALDADIHKSPDWAIGEVGPMVLRNAGIDRGWFDD